MESSAILNTVFRNILFVVFFCAGIAAMAVAILAGEILEYYEGQIKIYRIEQANHAIRQLDEKTVRLIEQIEDDPEILKRLVPIKTGQDVNEPGAILPKVSEAELEKAMQALKEMKAQQGDIEPVVPGWVMRINGQLSRYIILIAGAALVLVSFSCFNIRKQD